jgi:hypothetical protein
MMAAVQTIGSSFNDRVFRLLERVECRYVEAEAERADAYKIRYDAYRRESFIGPSNVETLSDAYDRSENGRVFGIFIDGEMASTLRLHIGNVASDRLPSLGVFGDVIRPKLEQGFGLVDPTRFAVKFEFSRRFPELAYVTTRLSWLAMEYAKANYLLAAIRSEHQGFYRRIFGHVPWTDEREYPGVTCKIVCMGLDFRARKDRVEARYPFFRSTQKEREKLFGWWGKAGAAPPTGTTSRELRAARI